MKDSYSLDVDHDALQVSYQKHIAAYDRIFERCGIDCMMVDEDPGMMGGDVSHAYMAYAEAGEDEIVFCRGCGYAANVELAVAGPDRRAAALARRRRAPSRSTCWPTRSSPRPRRAPSPRWATSSGCRRAPS